jgi:hypothetical protein
LARQGSLRQSVHDLGKYLAQLQVLAKKHHQSFRGVVEAEPISLPTRTVYNYIAGYKKAGELSDGVFAKVQSAGFDPAQKRILTKLHRLGNRVKKMTAVELAEKLEKGGDEITPLRRLKNALDIAATAFIAYAKDAELSDAEAIEQFKARFQFALVAKRIHKINKSKKVVSISKAA